MSGLLSLSIFMRKTQICGDLGRLYGTVGFTIERSFLEIEVMPAEKDSSNDEDALKFLRRFHKSYDFPPIEVIVKSYIPNWVGIGFHKIRALSLGDDFGIEFTSRTYS